MNADKRSIPDGLPDEISNFPIAIPNYIKGNSSHVPVLLLSAEMFPGRSGSRAGIAFRAWSIRGYILVKPTDGKECRVSIKYSVNGVRWLERDAKPLLSLAPSHEIWHFESEDIEFFNRSTKPVFKLLVRYTCDGWDYFDNSYGNNHAIAYPLATTSAGLCLQRNSGKQDTPLRIVVDGYAGFPDTVELISQCLGEKNLMREAASFVRYLWPLPHTVWEASFPASRKSGKVFFLAQCSISGKKYIDDNFGRLYEYEDGRILLENYAEFSSDTFIQGLNAIVNLVNESEPRLWVNIHRNDYKENSGVAPTEIRLGKDEPSHAFATGSISKKNGTYLFNGSMHYDLSGTHVEGDIECTLDSESGLRGVKTSVSSVRITPTGGTGSSASEELLPISMVSSSILNTGDMTLETKLTTTSDQSELTLIVKLLEGTIELHTENQPEFATRMVNCLDKTVDLSYRIITCTISIHAEKNSIDKDINGSFEILNDARPIIRSENEWKAVRAGVTFPFRAKGITEELTPTEMIADWLARMIEKSMTELFTIPTAIGHTNQAFGQSSRVSLAIYPLYRRADGDVKRNNIPSETEVSFVEYPTETSKNYLYYTKYVDVPVLMLMVDDLSYRLKKKSEDNGGILLSKEGTFLCKIFSVSEHDSSILEVTLSLKSTDPDTANEVPGETYTATQIKQNAISYTDDKIFISFPECGASVFFNPSEADEPNLSALKSFLSGGATETDAVVHLIIQDESIDGTKQSARLEFYDKNEKPKIAIEGSIDDTSPQTPMDWKSAAIFHSDITQPQPFHQDIPAISGFSVFSPEDNPNMIHLDVPRLDQTKNIAAFTEAEQNEILNEIKELDISLNDQEKTSLKVQTIVEGQNVNGLAFSEQEAICESTYLSDTKIYQRKRMIPLSEDWRTHNEQC